MPTALHEAAYDAGEACTPRELLSQMVRPAALPKQYRSLYPDVATGPGIPDLVSVIIPVYNRVDYLERAIHSVTNQSWPETEVVVVDDGSTEDVRPVIAKFGSAVRCIRQQNSGVASARNRGLRAARGEFIAFLDSDDTWDPGKLCAQMAVMRTFQDVVMVWTDMRAVGDDGRVLEPRFLRKFYQTSYDEMHDREPALARVATLADLQSAPTSLGGDTAILKGDLFSSMFFGNLVHTSTVLCRRKRVVDGGGFDVRLQHSGEDYDFHWRTCFFGDVALIDTPLVSYRVGGEDQLTAPGWSSDMARNTHWTVRSWLRTFGDEPYVSRQDVRRRLAFIEHWCGESLVLSGQAGGVRWLLRSALRQPFRRRTWSMLALGLLPRAARDRLLVAWRRRRVPRP